MAGGDTERGPPVELDGSVRLQRRQNRDGTITFYQLVRPKPPADLFGKAMALIIMLMPLWMLQ